MRSQNEYAQNAQTKRGLVTQTDPKKHRVKVKFDDEDETESMWVDVLAKGSAKYASFSMPSVGDEAWCALDPKGEDGCVLGTKYNDKDKPPWSKNEDEGLKFPGGTIHIDKNSGKVTVNVNGDVTVTSQSKVTVTAPEIVLNGNVKINGTLSHGGTNVGQDHQHINTMPGPGKSGPPE
ncbi:MAG: phage baseplate assembly protein V [Hyphomicrobiales bacterium]|nr:phage baseplate assembly protein V [Hyphomicrobiales bacterium]